MLTYLLFPNSPFLICASRWYVCSSRLVSVGAHVRVYVCTMTVLVRVFEDVCLNKVLTDAGFKEKQKQESDKCASISVCVFDKMTDRT